MIKSSHEKYTFKFMKYGEKRHHAKDYENNTQAILNSFYFKGNEGISIIFEPILNNTIVQSFEIILSLYSMKNFIKKKGKLKLKDAIKFEFIQRPNNSFISDINNTKNVIQSPKFNKIKLKLLKLNNKLIIYNNNDILYNVENSKSLIKFKENKIIYFCLISSSNNFIIHDLHIILNKEQELMNLIKSSKFIYEYNTYNKYIKNIKIKNENIKINLLKDLNCNFENSYIISNNIKNNLFQLYENDYILLKPLNLIKKKSNFIPIIKCENITEEKLICIENNEKNVCYFNNNKKKKSKLRKLEDNNYIIITVEGNIGNTIEFIKSTYKDYIYKVELNSVVMGGGIFQVELNQDGINEIKAFFNEGINDISYMFSGFSQLKTIDLSHFDTSLVNNMEYLFYYCTSLTSINLSNFKTSSTTKMSRMFQKCSSLISLDLSDFDTSSVEDMSSMFSMSSGLISLDLSNFYTPSVSTTSLMFYQCTSLQSLNLCNFITTSVTDMSDMFEECSSLTSLDLSSFNTASVRDMGSMFKGCSLLINLDLSNFSTNSVTSMGNIFSRCSSLNFLNLFDFDISGNDIFSTLPENLLICMQNYDDLPETHNLKQKNSINDCSNTVFQDRGTKGYYLDNNIYKPCYSTCKRCITNGDDIHHNCLECISNYIFIDDIGYENNCFKQCQYQYYFDELNKYNCISKELSTETKDEMITNFDNIIIDKDPSLTYFIIGEDYSIIIKPIDTHIAYSTVDINFEECTKILSENYLSYEFRMVQINIKDTNKIGLIDNVLYKIYNQYGDNIELSPCDNIKVDIEYKINDDNSLLNVDKIEYFKNMGVDIFNLKDSFFNDICYPYSDKDTNSDMILIDRVSDIYQNYSICEKGCEYDSFNIDKMSSKCKCEIKKEVSNENNKVNLKTYFVSSFLESNFGVIKCYNLVLQFKGKLQNIGFLIIGPIIIFHIPIYFFYLVNKIDKIVNYINNEMDRKGYKIIQNKQNKNLIKNKGTSSLRIETTKELLSLDNKDMKKRRKKRKKRFLKKFQKSVKKKENPPKKKKIKLTDNEQKKTINKKDNNISKKAKSKKINKKDINNNIDLSLRNSRKKKKIFKNKKNIKKNQFISEIQSNEIFLNQNNNCNKAIKNKKKLRQINEKNKITTNEIINKNTNEYPLIKIHAKNEGDHTPFESNFLLNNYNYEEAVCHDKRNFCRIFFIYLISKNELLNLFYFNPPLELKPLRICVFIFHFSCDLALNALFYLSDNISDNYHYIGQYKLLHMLINNINISLVSIVVTYILLSFLQALTQSSNKIEKLFIEQDNLLKSNKKYKVNQFTILKIRNDIFIIMKCLKIKIMFFFIFELLIMLFFFYYIVSFCHVYEKTQISWLLDNLSSYVMSLIIAFIVSFIGTILYKISIKHKYKKLYNFILFIYYFC